MRIEEKAFLSNLGLEKENSALRNELAARDKGGPWVATLDGMSE